MKAKVALGILIAVVLYGMLLLSQRRSESMTVSGFIEADAIRVGSRVGGRVAEVAVEEGQRVTVGQVLVRLEPFDLRERMLELEAALAGRRAELAKMEKGWLPQEIAQAQARVDQFQATASKLKSGPLPEEIIAAKSRLALAQAQLERAKKGHDRTMAMATRDTGAVSRDEIDLAVETLKVAQAGEQVRREELILLEKGTRSEDIASAVAVLQEAAQGLSLAKAGFREEEVAKAKAGVQSAEAAVNVVKAQIDELEIRAGVNGVVDALQMRPGDLVPPNSPVLTLIDTSRLWVRAYVPEDRLNLNLGDVFEVAVDSYPNQRFHAELSFVSANAEFTPRNVQTVDERVKQMFRVKLYLRDGLDRLRPGMAADLVLDSHK